MREHNSTISNCPNGFNSSHFREKGGFLDLSNVGGYMDEVAPQTLAFYAGRHCKKGETAHFLEKQ
jgi:hypothetical protein